MVEEGKAYWLCPECETAFFDESDFAYGHDCEVF